MKASSAAPGWALLAVVAVGTAGGLLLRHVGVPGGLIVGAAAGSLAASLAFRRDVELPQPVVTGVLVVVGIQVGMLVTRATITALGSLLLPAVLASVALILVGLATSWAYGSRSSSPAAALLGPSPGGLEALTALAAERDLDVAEVAAFHVIRLLLVVVSLPLVLRVV